MKRTPEQLTADVFGTQNLQQLQQRGNSRGRTGLVGLSAYPKERDGKTGQMIITTNRGDELRATDIGFGSHNGDRYPTAIKDGATTWVDY